VSDPKPPESEPYIAINTAAMGLLSAYRASPDPHVRFVLGELAPAHYAFVRARAESGERPPIGHLMFLRLTAEVGVRLGWIARDIERGGEAAVRASIDALVKRDLMHLQKANKALRQESPELTKAIATMGVTPAPATLSAMAADAPIAGTCYAMFRFASALIHPGVGLRSVVGRVPDMEVGLRDSILSCIVLAADLLAELAPATEGVDVDVLLREPLFFGFSPTALALRLRKELRKLLGRDAPKIANTGLHFGFAEGTETFRFEVELQRGERTWQVTSVGHDAEQAFQDFTRDVTESVSAS
jgi:hypothetical protein